MNAVFRTGVRPSGDTQELVIARETYRVLDITETGVRGQCGVSIAPTGAAMVYAKAFAVGVVTGSLAPIVVGAASILWFLMTTLVGRLAATGGAGIVGVSVGIAFFDSMQQPTEN